MKRDNEQYCKENGLIPIKSIFVYSDVDFKKSHKINFKSDYAIKINKTDDIIINIDIISLKRAEPLILDYNDYCYCYILYINGYKYYLTNKNIKNYLAYLEKKGEYHENKKP